MTPEPLQDERRWTVGQYGALHTIEAPVGTEFVEVSSLDQALAERDRLAKERDVLWQALVDIAGWENWQEPTWRTIAQAALSHYEALKEEAKAQAPKPANP